MMNKMRETLFTLAGDPGCMKDGPHFPTFPQKQGYEVYFAFWSEALRRPLTVDIIPSVQFLTSLDTGNTGIERDQMLILQESEAAKHCYGDGLLTKTRKSKFGGGFQDGEIKFSHII